MAATRENNFKNPHRNSRNKDKLPRRNPSATLSYYSYQVIDGKKELILFFWGYRTHVIVSKEGIPLVSITLPNNVTDAKVARKLIKKLKRIYGLKKGSFFIADAAYDERELYNFIVNQLKCLAFIPINPRNQQFPKTFGSHGCPLCDANLEMASVGTWTENLRMRVKFRCPIKASRSFARQYPDGCSVQHVSFSDGNTYGCTKYLDITDDARSRVPRNSAFFKQTFLLRTEIERYFPRLGDREVEQTTHYKMRAIRNQMAIAHLSMSLVASAAAILLERTGQNTLLPDLRRYRLSSYGRLTASFFSATADPRRRKRTFLPTVLLCLLLVKIPVLITLIYLLSLFLLPPHLKSLFRRTL